MNLDERDEMEKLDLSKILETIEKFPEQCGEAIEIGRKFAGKLKIKKPERVVVCGMGGSGIAGDMLAGMFPEKDIRVFKDYSLPEHVKRGDLVFVISYSGNTEETLSAFRECVRRGCKTIAVTSGGELERLCVRHSKAYVKIPRGLKPRFATGYLLIPIIIILEKIKFVRKQNLELVVKNLRETREEIKPDVPTEDNPAKRLALKLEDSIPVVQGFGMYAPVAYRARTQFNENSKLPSFSEVYPELNHNSILGWEGGDFLARNFSVIIIRDEEEDKKTKKRIEFTKGVMKKSARLVTEVWSVYPSRISRMLSTMYVLDFVSVYLAFLRGKDPGDDSLLLKLKTILREDK